MQTWISHPDNLVTIAEVSQETRLDVSYIVKCIVVCGDTIVLVTNYNCDFSKKCAAGVDLS